MGQHFGGSTSSTAGALGTSLPVPSKQKKPRPSARRLLTAAGGGVSKVSSSQRIPSGPWCNCDNDTKKKTPKHRSGEIYRCKYNKRKMNFRQREEETTPVEWAKRRKKLEIGACKTCADKGYISSGHNTMKSPFCYFNKRGYYAHLSIPDRHGKMPAFPWDPECLSKLNGRFIKSDNINYLFSWA